MITKIYGIDFKSEGGALTLESWEVGDYEIDGKEYSKTHKDGWTITAKVKEDYYEWINEFRAEHPVFGKVWGDFEDKVYADTEEGFNDFYSKHKPTEWDYGDI